jgi:hypothetical protein
MLVEFTTKILLLRTLASPTVNSLQATVNRSNPPQRIGQTHRANEEEGGVGMGIKVDNQTLPFDKLELTPKEKGELVAFMKSLDSKGDRLNAPFVGQK